MKRPQIIAQKNFLDHRDSLEQLALEDRFQYIFDHNLWSSEESRSGVGSTLEETAQVRSVIPALLTQLGAESILDIPCGDHRWMSQLDLGDLEYTGADIVEALVKANAKQFPNRHFVQLDLTASPLPRADVVLCRDCLVHLSHANIRKALGNIQRSRSKWLLMTNFLDPETPNADIADGDWRPLNFELAPFGLPKPTRVILENCTEGNGAFADKALCLWPIEKLPDR
jgi:Methyltransferase domain